MDLWWWQHYDGEGRQVKLMSIAWDLVGWRIANIVSQGATKHKKTPHLSTANHRDYELSSDAFAAQTYLIQLYSEFNFFSSS
jgi:hypothetical protein